MSDLDSKSEQHAPAQDSTARCTLAQLAMRHGDLRPEHPRKHLAVGNVFVLVGMGPPERWVVTAIAGSRVELALSDSDKPRSPIDLDPGVKAQ